MYPSAICVYVRDGSSGMLGKQENSSPSIILLPLCWGDWERQAKINTPTSQERTFFSEQLSPLNTLKGQRQFGKGLHSWQLAVLEVLFAVASEVTFLLQDCSPTVGTIVVNQTHCFHFSLLCNRNKPPCVCSFKQKWNKQGYPSNYL